MTVPPTLDKVSDVLDWLYADLGNVANANINPFADGHGLMYDQTSSQWNNRPMWAAWQADTTHYPGQTIYDGSWLGSPKKPTQTRLAPQPVGPQIETGEFTGWTGQQANVSQLVCGLRVTYAVNAYLEAVRYTEPHAASDRTHQLWYVGEPLSASPQITQLRGVWVPENADSPTTLNVGQRLVQAGTTFDIVMITQSSGSPSTFTGRWQMEHKNDDGDPGEGKMWHHSTNGRLKFNYVDDNDTSWETQMRAFTIGGTISYGGYEYSIYDINEFGSYIEYFGTPTSRPGENTYDMTFNWSAPVPLDYDVITNHYDPAGSHPAKDSLQGLYSETGYASNDPSIVNENAYNGLELLVRAAEVNFDDWHILPHY